MKILSEQLGKEGIEITREKDAPADAALFFSPVSEKELRQRKRLGNKLLALASSFPSKVCIPGCGREIRPKNAGKIRAFYRKADVLFAPNPFLSGILQQTFPAKKVLVFPFFFNLSDFRKTDLPADLNHYRPGEKYVLSVGGNGLLSSPSLYFSFARSFPANRFVYLLNGESSASSKKERKAYKNRPANVEILREDSLQDPFSLFAHASAFVLPNPLCASFPELYAAFASGVPVVMRSQPGFFESSEKLPFSFSDTTHAEFVSDLRSFLTGDVSESVLYGRKIVLSHEVESLSPRIASLLREALETAER